MIYVTDTNDEQHEFSYLKRRFANSSVWVSKIKFISVTGEDIAIINKEFPGFRIEISPFGSVKNVIWYGDFAKTIIATFQGEG